MLYALLILKSEQFACEDPAISFTVELNQKISFAHFSKLIAYSYIGMETGVRR